MLNIDKIALNLKLLELNVKWIKQNHFDFV